MIKGAIMPRIKLGQYVFYEIKQFIKETGQGAMVIEENNRIYAVAARGANVNRARMIIFVKGDKK